MLTGHTRAVNAFPPSTPLLVVSPHLDDAAFSCAALLDRGLPVDVLTVFAGEPQPPIRGWWDERCGFASSAESVPVRRLEDERALAPGGHRLNYLDLLEEQHIDGPRPPAEAERIADAVRAWSAEAVDGTVAIPAGAGWAPYWLPARVVIKVRPPRGPEPHGDHVLVRDAVLAAGLDGERLVLYEELPYLWGGSAARAARDAARRRDLHARRQVVPVDREAKARRIGVYASQVPEMSPAAGRLDSPEVLPPTETYWQLVRPR